MKKFIVLCSVILCYGGFLIAQHADTTQIHNLDEIVVSANKLPITLKNNPGAISLVSPKMLTVMPKGIAVEEALRLVPGIRIDNQHNGERVHVSIRGQGILTERGLRGIGVLLDGIPVNDPSGFAPDLYDVDWLTVNRVEVMRGPAAGLYGGGGAAGVLMITTNNGGNKPVGGMISQTLGSNGFLKSLVQLDGSKEEMDYRISYSHTKGDGYRDHQAFWGNNFYEKINFHPSDKLKLTQIISHTDYFHQNPEGLNLGQFDNLRQANPDARPFNEFQKTNRTTVGLHGNYVISAHQDVDVTTYLREWKYKETSNKAAEYRDITNPGASAQYNLHLGSAKVKHNISAGVDLKWQKIGMYKLMSGSDPNRIESTDEANIELDTLLANQLIDQSGTGVFGLYNLAVGKFNFIGNIRYDNIKNQLTDKMMVGDTATTSEDFSQTSFRIGASYNFTKLATAFTNWSSGFVPPSTEELASNPLGYSGFNSHLVPATAICYELGFRGYKDDKFSYEITAFLMNTEDDFFRFKQSGRGNQEVFYGNAGNSQRFGIETYIDFRVLKNLTLQAAYTYSDFTYTSAEIDPIYTDPNYVLTTPPTAGQWLPNCPRHQLYAEVTWIVIPDLTLSLGTEFQSKWAIYTDARAYNDELDPTIYRNWQDGFNLYHARITYQWNLWKLNGELSVSARNFTGEKYMAFTEPDPDGNSYQPGPGSEFFGNILIKF